MKDRHFLYYAALKAKRSQFIDTIYFNKLRVIRKSWQNIDKPITKCAFGLLNAIRRRKAVGRTSEEMKSRKVVEYIEKNFVGKKLHQIEYHKYFFGNEMQVIPLPEVDKKKKRAKKSKKQAADNTQDPKGTKAKSPLGDVKIKDEKINKDETIDTDNAATGLNSLPFSIDIIKESEAIKIKELATTLRPASKSNITKRKGEVEDHQETDNESSKEENKEFSDAETSQSIAQTEQQLDKAVGEIKSSNSVGTEANRTGKAQNSESDEKSAKAKKHKNSVRNGKAAKLPPSSKKLKNKAQTAIKKEYEELKMNTLKFFKQTTLVTNDLKPKKIQDYKQETLMAGKEVDETSEAKNTKESPKYHYRHWKKPPFNQHRAVTYRKKIYHNESPKEVQEMDSGMLYFSDVPRENMAVLNDAIDETMRCSDSLNERLFAVQNVVVRLVEEHAAKCFGKDQKTSGVKASLYGSVATGLALQDSDIDIVLNNVVALSAEEYISNLLKLGDYFRGQEFVKTASTITTARAPVIKLVL